MLKRPITYTDFNGEKQTDICYFNLSMTEMMEIEVADEAGIEATIIKMTKEKDKKKLYEMFEKLVLGSYGHKTEDGKRFIKSDQIREEFKQSAAYDALLWELIASEQVVAEFMMAVLPKELTEMAKKNKVQDKPTGLPKPPMPPTI